MITVAITHPISCRDVKLVARVEERNPAIDYVGIPDASLPLFLGDTYWEPLT